MVFVFALFSCVEPSGLKLVDTALPEPSVSTFTPIIQDHPNLTQPLDSQCADFDLLDDHRWLCVEDEQAWLIDEAHLEPTLLGTALHAGGTVFNGELWLHLDGQLYTYENGLEPVPLDVPVPIERLEAHSDSLWLWGVNRLFQLQSGQLKEVFLSEDLLVYDFAVSSTHLWLRTPWLLEIDIQSEPFTVRSKSDDPIDDLQVDTDGVLWWLRDGQLFRQDATASSEPASQAIEVLLPTTPLFLTGPELWIAAEDAQYRLLDGVFHRLDLSHDVAQQVDEHGRLVFHDGSGLMRASIDRPVVVVSSSDTLTVQQEFRLLPSDPDSLDSLRVWLDSTELTVETNPWTITLDPEDFDVGAHELRFWTESELGDGIDTHPVWFGELPDVEWSDVEVISEAQCLSCHGGATLTTLVDRDDWITHIDTIIHEVSTEGMPLGGPYLSYADITTIRAWKAGGFQ